MLYCVWHEFKTHFVGGSTNTAHAPVIHVAHVKDEGFIFREERGHVLRGVNSVEDGERE